MWQNVVDLAVSDFHTVALLADGRVVSSAGYNHAGQAEVENLMYAAGDKRIVAVSAGYDHTLALLEDGTVVGCGDRQSKNNDYNGSCAVGSWTDIAAIYSGTEFSAGLRLDGTVVVAGVDWNMSDWTDIVNLAAGDYFLLGLKSDGTVVCKAIHNSDTEKSFRYGCLEVEWWQNVVHIAAGSDQAVAVTADGTVYCIGADDKGQCVLNRQNRNG
jgi:alpha-tubulin suppressor-like RCC1 family protein